MTVIQLLNKIANGEEVPKKIRVPGAWTEGIAFELDDYKHYKHENIDDTYDDLFDDLDNIDLDDFLNTEIIEEDKKIEKLKIVENGSINSYALLDKNGTKCALTKHSKILADIINEIIDVINKGDK
jgi:hypothetical protein